MASCSTTCTFPSMPSVSTHHQHPSRTGTGLATMGFYGTSRTVSMASSTSSDSLTCSKSKSTRSAQQKVMRWHGWLTTPTADTKKKRRVQCSASGDESASEGPYIPFPFNKEEYLEVAMQLVHPYRSAEEVQQATIILYSRSSTFLDLVQKKQDKATLSKIKDEKCLVVEIGGDTVSNISAALESTKFSRPLALDLLWQVLQRGQQISKSDWALVRVAIVDLRGGTFIGRLFFGDRDQERIYWDCDCRPSDGIWLALQSKCPVYVSKSVWNLASVPLSKLVVMSQEQEIDEEGLEGYYAEGGKIDEDALKLPLLGLKNEDPEPIKRLKRELQVALAEEDYGAAIRIRDHPFMVLYTEMENRRDEGKEAEAAILSEELNKAIKESGEAEET